MLISFEDYGIHRVKSKILISNELEVLGEFNNKKCVLVLRDPYNLFASRICNRSEYHSTVLKLEHFVKLWKEFAREYLGETDYLFNRTVISFDEWFKNIDYRKLIINELGLEFTDVGLQDMMKECNGSSFDRYKYKNKCQKMLVLDRSKKVVTNCHFKKILRDKELFELSSKIFGDLEVVNYVRGKL